MHQNDIFLDITGIAIDSLCEELRFIFRAVATVLKLCKIPNDSHELTQITQLRVNVPHPNLRQRQHMAPV